MTKAQRLWKRMNQFTRASAHNNVVRIPPPSGREYLSKHPALRIWVVLEQMTRLNDRLPHSGRWPKWVDTGTKINQVINATVQLSRCRIYVSSMTVRRYATHNDPTARTIPSPHVITAMRTARSISSSVGDLAPSPILGFS